jgi:hypothetical protein
MGMGIGHMGPFGPIGMGPMGPPVPMGMMGGPMMMGMGMQGGPGTAGLPQHPCKFCYLYCLLDPLCVQFLLGKPAIC